jgi:hypothetical protein
MVSDGKFSEVLEIRKVTCGETLIRQRFEGVARFERIARIIGSQVAQRSFYPHKIRWKRKFP